MVCGRYKFMSPWSSTLESLPAIRLFSASRSKAPSHQCCTSLETAVQYISDYYTLHSAHDQNCVTFAIALMLPLAYYDRISILLPVPRMCTAPSRIRSSAESIEEPIYGRDIRQFDRLLTLSCNPHRVKSILGSIFYEPSVLCNTCGQWLQGTATVLQSGLIQNLDILTRTFSLRSPHLSSLWLGAIIAGFHRSFLEAPEDSSDSTGSIFMKRLGLAP
ncbi:hypothetical protein FOMG_02208 [Fusarium oxysporum f. sp. melonis 26406]|uniref:Uncharacterized protein n=1 Tax=Fusarium oxysporum f. sp. melonis 26406 TaxID=1089452 RepID=X0BA55_FUSOX|nr:hypothetical protein FOMG_02208 [Fusarium oxysporum f. sp. melonis 26406]